MSEQIAEEEVNVHPSGMQRQSATDNEPEGLRQRRWTALLLVATGALQVLINTPWMHTWLTVRQKHHRLTTTTFTRRDPYQDLWPRARPQVHLPRRPPTTSRKTLIPTSPGMQLRSSTRSGPPFCLSAHRLFGGTLASRTLIDVPADLH